MTCICYRLSKFSPPRRSEEEGRELKTKKTATSAGLSPTGQAMSHVESRIRLNRLNRNAKPAEMSTACPGVTHGRFEKVLSEKTLK